MLVLHEPMRLLNYSGRHFGGMALAGVLDSVALIFWTIACQNERSGFILMIGYIGVVYAFFGDLFIFNLTFSAGEIVGAGIVVTFTVYVIIFNLYCRPAP
jgi:drug/metabolite transporter (DMT)-like permease